MPMGNMRSGAPGGDQRRVQFSVDLPVGANLALTGAVQASLEKAIRLVLSDPKTGQDLLTRADDIARLVTSIAEPDESLLIERRRRQDAMRTVFDDGQWLTAEDINALQKTPPASKSQPASDWKRRDRVYSVSVNGREYFAAYQFDTFSQPLPIIREILEALGPLADTWKIAAWFHFPNGWISDDEGRPVAPKDALDRREDVIGAARRYHGSYVA
ncbi:hypothetical protein [Paraburkholderia sp. J8-2]|uniref:hypothetical protein n=1 Tax=Paraburkholderia sp. J8-2 TaxID=2805440 RepID=UPI002AB652B0|nr:hypothetical protein [Paraburkholderia sp. J8-2]